MYIIYIYIYRYIYINKYSRLVREARSEVEEVNTLNSLAFSLSLMCLLQALLPVSNGTENFRKTFGSDLDPKLVANGQI